MIPTDKILQTDFLDLLFERRNKMYGAYQLRKNYSKRLLISLIAVFGSIAFISATVFLSGVISSAFKKKKAAIEITAVTLEDFKKEVPKAPPPPPPPKPPEPKVEMKKFTPPKIVQDNEVKKEEIPPEVTQLEDTRIGSKDQEGVKDLGIVEAPVATPEAPKAPVVEEVLTKVEIDAGFPGGNKGWLRFVEREINKYIDDLTDAGFSGTVLVQFIVDREGNVSDVKALSNGHTKLAEIAIKAIGNGPKWIPAVQNGKPVKAYRKQPITFRIEE